MGLGKVTFLGLRMSAVVAVPRVARVARRVRIGTRCIFGWFWFGVLSLEGVGWEFEDLEQCGYGLELIYRWKRGALFFFLFF